MQLSANSAAFTPTHLLYPVSRPPVPVRTCATGPYGPAEKRLYKPTAKKKKFSNIHPR